MVHYRDAMRAQYYLPPLQKHQKRLEESLDKLKPIWPVIDVETIIDGIIPQLALVADQMVLPVIANEIHIAKKKGRLIGNSSKERYDSFFIRHSTWTAEARAIPQKYPFLIEMINSYISSCIDNICECVKRLNSDLSSIITWLGHDIGRLTNINVSGDRHDEGRQVLILSFNTGHRLVYKPKSVTPDILWRDFLNMLDIKYPYDLRSVSVLPRDTYGWLEYIDYLPCYTLEEIKTFYKRAGSLLAVTDTLNYCDGHFENLIAHGSYPVLIDCETLFHSFSSTIDPILGERSILFTGLVQRNIDEERGRGLNAALQVRGFRRNQYLYTYPINDRTDQLQVRFQGQNEELSGNSPIYNGYFQTAATFINEVVDGYQHTFDLISKKASNILDNEIWWSKLSKVKVRQLIRHTMYYLFLIRKIQQPEGCFGRDTATNIIEPLLVSNDDNINQLVKYEIEALLSFDIPYFYHYPGNSALYNSQNKCYVNYFERSVIEQIGDQLKTRSTTYRDRQIVILKKHLPSSAPPIQIDSWHQLAQNQAKKYNLIFKNSDAIPIAANNYHDFLNSHEQLREVIGDARLVVLGEATHGTREFFEIKADWFKFLVEEMGFKTLALETSWSQAQFVNEYIKNGQGDPKSLLRKLGYWTWYTEEILDLIIWMKQYNEKNRDNRLLFSGFDILFTDLAMDSVIDYLSDIDIKHAQDAHDLYLFFRSYQAKSKEYSSDPYYIRIKCKQSLLQVYNSLKEREELYIAKTSNKSFEEALQNARVVLQSEHYFSISDHIESAKIRDQFMAENIMKIIDMGGTDNKVVIWTHNAHANLQVNPYGFKSMGSYLKQHLGKDMINVGFCFYEGAFNAMNISSLGQLSGPYVHQATLPPSKSYEELLHDLGIPFILVDCRQLNNDEQKLKSLQGPHNFRSIGAVYSENSPNYLFYKAKLPLEFDLVAYIERTSPSKLLTD